jgi:FlaA1/EpsC-like NDP-sugar epimerase
MKKSPRLYIIGAGFAGRNLASEIRAKAILGTVVAFLDDDPAKIGKKSTASPCWAPFGTWPGSS